MGDGLVTSDQCGDLALLGIDEKREKDRLGGAEVRRWRAKLERKLLLWLLRRPVKDGLMQRSGFQTDSFDATYYYLRRSMGATGETSILGGNGRLGPRSTERKKERDKRPIVPTR